MGEGAKRYSGLAVLNTRANLERWKKALEVLDKLFSEALYLRDGRIPIRRAYARFSHYGFTRREAWHFLVIFKSLGWINLTRENVYIKLGGGENVNRQRNLDREEDKDQSRAFEEN